MGNGRLRSRTYTDIIRDPTTLAQWEELALAASEPRSLPSIPQAWYKHVATQQQIRIITVWSDDALVGVLPLAVRRDRWGRVICHIAGQGTIAAVQPLVAERASTSEAAEIEEAFSEALMQLRPLPDIIAIESVRRGGALLAATALHAKRPPSIRSSPVRAPFIDLRVEQDTPKDAGRNGRRRRRLADLGYHLNVLTDPEAMTARLPALRQLYNERKAKRGGEGMNFDMRMSEMIREMFYALGEAGNMVLFSLERPDDILALNCVLTCGDRASGWLTAVSERESQYSPGLRVQEDVFDWARSAGYREFDLGPGDEGYKSRTSSGTVILDDASLMRRDIFPINTPVSLAPERLQARARNFIRRRGGKG
jgi:CelD/BcsL family acetyltransferase involved in cellulose biosynthesis